MAGVAAGGNAAADERAYGGVLEDGWRVAVVTGTLAVSDGTDTGTARTVALANGAHVINDRGRYWDFEVGLAYTQTAAHPKGAGGETVRVNQTDAYYQARRLFGESPWFLGWHVALTRTSIQPADTGSDRDLGFTAGVIAGYRGSGRFGFQVDALVTDPDPEFGDLTLGYETRQYRASLQFRF
ncbi:hypothetical protein CKO14_08050 [Halorhodospira halophila]|nr:hypothetical protein [Halorhodospira halophila]